MIKTQGELSADITDYCTACLIEPVKQKIFQFSYVSTSQQIGRPSKSRHTDEGWKPVLSFKRLEADPRFIMSLQRRKARIISGIRDRQVEDRQKKLLGLVGGKVKNKHYFRNLHTKSFLNSTNNMEQIVSANENKFSKNQLKQKKNPNMNFSLLYICERKKNCETQIKSKTRVSSAYHSGSHREKGSDNAYLHMMCESNNRKQKIRPKTSCLTDRNRANDRPKSQFY